MKMLRWFHVLVFCLLLLGQALPYARAYAEAPPACQCACEHARCKHCAHDDEQAKQNSTWRVSPCNSAQAKLEARHFMSEPCLVPESVSPVRALLVWAWQELKLQPQLALHEFIVPPPRV